MSVSFFSRSGAKEDQRARTVGPLDDGLLYREMGRRAGGEFQFSYEVDERGRQDALSGLFRQ